jgi:hypothetical protein
VQPNWAEENLQVIRTLMERAGPYRRALAPVMFSAGLLGLVAAVIGNQFDAIAPRHKGFLYYWTVVCAFALVVVSSIIRRQAVRDGESFWTAPMKRVTQSLLPHFAGGALFTCSYSAHMAPSDGLGAGYNQLIVLQIVTLWLAFYGCSLCAAGQFISAGVRRLGLCFILSGAAIYLNTSSNPKLWHVSLFADPNFVMGLTFGGFHLLAAAYLYFTEKREPTP